MTEQAWAKEDKELVSKKEPVAKPEDDEDAFEALEAEQKEFLKVSLRPTSLSKLC